MSPRDVRLFMRILITLSLLLGSLWPTAAPVSGAAPSEPGPSSATAPPLAPVPASAPQRPMTRSGSTYHTASGMTTSDPISANAGAYHFELPLMQLGGPMQIDIALRYRSDLGQLAAWGGVVGVPYGFWWSPLENMEYSHENVGGFASIQIRNGDALSFKRQGGQWVPTTDGDFGLQQNAYPTPWSLQETSDYFYLADPTEQQVHIFQKAVLPATEGDVGFSRIARIVDRNGNQIIYRYAAATDLHPTRIEDGLGHFVDLAYQTVGDEIALVRMADQCGRQVSFTHEAQGADNFGLWTLRAVTDAAGQTTTLRYTVVREGGWIWLDLITEVQRPRGNVPYTQSYAPKSLLGDRAARVVTQTNSLGQATTLAYDASRSVVTETQPSGDTIVYEHYGPGNILKAWTDPAGRTVQVGYDAQTKRMTGTTDRLGDTTHIAYHAPSGKMASYTDAEGRTTHTTFVTQTQTFTNPMSGESVAYTFYDPARITYANGTYQDFTYDARGNLIRYTDWAGQVWRYEVNARGQVTRLTVPTGGVVNYTYRADATLATSSDSDVGITSYGYDSCKRLVRITRPDGSAQRFAYDAANRLLSMTDELSRTTAIAYDTNGNPAATTLPSGATMSFAYDALDRLSGRTDALGHTATYAYDVRGLPASYTDRRGDTTTYTHDALGEMVRVTDPGGRSWRVAYDAEQVPTEYATPLGRTTAVQRDKVGNLIVVTDPLGQSTRMDYDALNRLTTLTDRMGRTTTYTYDPHGWLQSVSKSLIGTVNYTRDNLGMLTRITDLRGKHWDFGYSPMGRLTSRTDPLGNQWRYTMDARGRVTGITYPDGGVAAFTHDAAGQVTRIAYPGGPTLSYAYDALGHMLATENLALTYDARGDVIGSRQGAAFFGASYDEEQRLATVTYDGQATVTYTYDHRGLLTRLEDNLAGAWMTFRYDNDARLIGLGRSNGVSTTLTYDAVGRVTRTQEGTLADRRSTFNAEGEPTQVMRTLPLEPRMTTQTTDLAFDDASQISSPGYVYDACGRQTAAPGKTFTWDGAGRLTSVRAGGSTAALAYNGLGNLRTRTVGSTTTTYYRNYALGLPGVVAEKMEAVANGAKPAADQGYKRFYIYTPSGSLLYSIDVASKAVRFYHFDDVGSTLFLTDGRGAVSDAYAYDPYGYPAGHTGPSDQPFTYVGRFGVRWEPMGALYDMRARYYDPAITRFLTRDAFWPRTTSIEELDPYVYAGNIPTLQTDPVGMSPRVTVWGTKYSIVDLWLTDINHHGLFFSFPDQTQSTAVDVTGLPYGRVNGQVSGAEIRQRHSSTLMDHLDWVGQNHSGVGSYNLGPDGIPLQIGVDEAQAALNLFKQLQPSATYDVAGGMTSCGYYIYCWETADILNQFLAMYRWVYKRTVEAIERMNTTCGDWQDPAKRRYIRTQLNLMSFSLEEMRTEFRALSRFGDIAAANWSQLVDTAFNQIANQLSQQSACSTGGRR